jgi:hypothetical protein
MRPCKAHVVTSCQQLLALGAVLAVLTPAASVVSLDVVHRGPGRPATEAPSTGTAPPGADRPARRPQAVRRARVPVAPVEPVVTEVPLTAGPEAGAQTRRDSAPSRTTERVTRTTVLSEPQPVTGYGAVGVTWSHDEQVADDRIALEVRTATGGTWSRWSELEYHDEHAPDPTSTEGLDTRPGTDLLFVGEVDRVQLRATAPDALPDGMSLAVVAPGRAAEVAREAPVLPAEKAPIGAEAGEDAIRLSADTTSAARPRIFTREQWGADERLRDGRPSYGTISAGFVHHTVNANAYSRAEVPGILRSIYAYHTRSRGWSDIGYNFLVDKFGRIWEGRYGGVARPVIGAHTLGYNDDSFAMSAIGNFETARPSDAMLRAYGKLFAWKLGLHGIDPTDMSRTVNGDSFAAVNGHRDAGSTACPGRHLYEKIPAIRRYADEAATEPETPEPVPLEQVDSDLASTPHPDLVVRRASDGRGLILPTGGFTRFVSPTVVRGSGWSDREFLATPDLTGDGRNDLVTFDSRGGLEIRPGPAADGFREVTRTARGFRGHDLVASTGDLDGDGRADFVTRYEGDLVAFLRTDRGGFRRVVRGTELRGYRQLVGAGDVTADGRPDLWARDGRGRLWLHRGLGNGRFATRTQVPGEYADVDWLTGGVDYTRDGTPDVVARRTSGALVLLPARGDGTLGRALGPVADGSGLTMISGAGQLTGHQAPDLVAADPDGALVVLPNRGTFDVGAPLDTGRSFARGDLLLNAGDFDGDGAGDVILRRRVGSLWLYRGRGDGRLTAPQWIGGKRPFRTVTGLRVVADLTGDGAHDLVGRVDGQLQAWPGNGAGRLGKRTPIEATDTSLEGVHRAEYDWAVRTSDLRRHGRPDVVVRDGDGYLYRLNGVRDGYQPPRYLGEAGDYDLAG